MKVVMIIATSLLSFNGFGLNLCEAYKTNEANLLPYSEVRGSDPLEIYEKQMIHEAISATNWDYFDDQDALNEFNNMQGQGSNGGLIQYYQAGAVLNDEVARVSYYPGAKETGALFKLEVTGLRVRVRMIGLIEDGTITCL